MTVTRVRSTIVGLLIMLSLALGVEASPIFHHAYWLWFTAFVGANLFQSGLTGWCLTDTIIAAFGVPPDSKGGKKAGKRRR